MSIVQSARRKPQRARGGVGLRRVSLRFDLANIKRLTFNDPLADIHRGLVQERKAGKVVVPFRRCD
jgi:hypothetical protein